MKPTRVQHNILQNICKDSGHKLNSNIASNKTHIINYDRMTTHPPTKKSFTSVILYKTEFCFCINYNKNTLGKISVLKLQVLSNNRYIIHLCLNSKYRDNPIDTRLLNMQRNCNFKLKSMDNDFCRYFFIAATVLDKNTVYF